jgi:prepilin-type processing-associated H-X9-DG protein
MRLAATTKYNLLFADGHAAATEIRRTDAGASADYTFYINK